MLGQKAALQGVAWSSGLSQRQGGNCTYGGEGGEAAQDNGGKPKTGGT